MEGVLCIAMIRRVRAAVVSLSALAASCSPAPPPSAPHPLLGGRPLRLTLAGDRGEMISIPGRGELSTVLYFWAITCEPCRRSLPALWAKRKAIEGQGGKLVLVVVLADAESTALARSTLTSWGVAAPFALDNDGAAQRQAGALRLPATLIVDRSGVVTWAAPDGATADDVVRAIR